MFKCLVDHPSDLFQCLKTILYYSSPKDRVVVVSLPNDPNYWTYVGRPSSKWVKISHNFSKKVGENLNFNHLLSHNAISLRNSSNWMRKKKNKGFKKSLWTNHTPSFLITSSGDFSELTKKIWGPGRWVSRCQKHQNSQPTRKQRNKWSSAMNGRGTTQPDVHRDET